MANSFHCNNCFIRNCHFEKSREFLPFGTMKKREIFTPDASDVFDEPIYWVPVPDVKKLNIPKFVPRETPALVWTVRDQLEYELRVSKRRRGSRGSACSSQHQQPTEQRDVIQGSQIQRVVAEDSSAGTPQPPALDEKKPQEEKHGAKLRVPQ